MTEIGGAEPRVGSPGSESEGEDRERLWSELLRPELDPEINGSFKRTLNTVALILAASTRRHRAAEVVHHPERRAGRRRATAAGVILCILVVRDPVLMEFVQQAVGQQPLLLGVEVRELHS